MHQRSAHTYNLLRGNRGTETELLHEGRKRIIPIHKRRNAKLNKAMVYNIEDYSSQSDSHTRKKSEGISMYVLDGR